MYDTIANDNPEGARRLLAKHGYNVPRNIRAFELADLLKQFVRKKGKSAVVKLGQIHPDRQFMHQVESGDYDHFDGGDCKCESCQKAEKSNASGCGCGDSDKLNIDGNLPTNKSSEKEDGVAKIGQYNVLIAFAMVNIAAMCFITVIALKK